MNGPAGFNRPGGATDEPERMEAAGGMDAQSGVHNALENAQTAFPTAPTRIIGIMALVKLLPMSPDRSVTYVAGRSIPNHLIPHQIRST